MRLIKAGLAISLIMVLVVGLMPFMSVERAVASGSWPSYDETQSFYPVTRYDIGNHAAAPGWEEFDASLAGVPAGASGVVLHVVNTSSSSYDLSARRKGDTWSTTPDMYGYSHTWIYCGLDSNLKFEVYRQTNALPVVYIEWYTTSDVGYVDPALNSFTTDAATQWEEYDLSSMVSASATGAILYAETTSYLGTKRGLDSLDIYRYSDNANFTFFLAPLDENQYASIYSQGAIDIYVIGYIEAGVYWPDPQPVAGTSRDGSYSDIFQSDGVVGVIFDVVYQLNNSSYDIRGVDDAGSFYQMNRQWSYACVATGTGGVIEAKFHSSYTGDVSIAAYLVGSSTGGYAETLCVNDSTDGTQDGTYKCHQRGDDTDTAEYVNDATPVFSAVYISDYYDEAYYYQIVVGDDTDLSDPGNVMWDSGKTAMIHTDEGDRCPDITYNNDAGGVALSVGTTYYWVIKFWDQDDNEGDWSEPLYCAYASFTVIDGSDYVVINDSNPLASDMVDTDQGTGNQVARDSTGRVYVLVQWGDWEDYASNYAIRIYYSDDDGETWNPSDYLTLVKAGDTVGVYTVQYAHYASITVDSDDHLHCLFSFTSTSSATCIAYNEYFGGVWGVPVFINTSYGAMDDLVIAVNSDDDVYCAYVSGTAYDRQILSFKQRTGVGWGAEVDLAGSGISGHGTTAYIKYLSMAIVDTDVYIVATSTPGDRNYLDYVPSIWYSTDSGSSFTHRQIAQLSDVDGAIYGCPVALMYEPENEELILAWERTLDILGTNFIDAAYSRINLDTFDLEMPSGYLASVDSVYATSRTASVADSKSVPGLYVGQTYNGANYTVYRSALWLDTTYIPSGGTITSATFYFYQNSGYIDNAWELVLVSGSDLSPSSGLELADYGDLLDETTALNNTYTVKSGDQGVESTDFNSTGIAYLTNALGGWVKLGLRSNRDISASAPGSGDDEFLTYTGSYTAYAPYVEMTIDYGGGDIRTYHTTVAVDPIHEDSDFMLQEDAVPYQIPISISRARDGVVYFLFGREIDTLTWPQGTWYRQYDATTDTWQNAEWLDATYSSVLGLLNQEYPSTHMMVASEGFLFSREGTIYWGAGAGGGLPPVPEAPTAPTELYCEGQTSPATNISDPSPEFSAIYNDPNAGDIADYYEVEVGTDTDWSSAEMWDSGKTSMSNTTEGTRCDDITYAGLTLQAATTYYWRIRFWDYAGLTGAWSADAQFTMADSSSAPTVNTIAADNIADTSARLNGELVFDGASPPGQYRFIYDTNSGYPYAYSTSWTGSVNAPDTFNETIYGLTPGVTYYFRAQVMDGAGTGTGSELSFTCSYGPATVWTQPASNISISSARLNAYLFSDGGESTSVRFRYGTTEDYYGSDDDSDTEIHGNNWASQVFVAGDTYSAYGGMIKIYKEGSPANDLTVEMWTTAAGDPSAIIAGATGTIDKDDVTTSSSGDWYACDFGTPASLTGTTTYALVVYTTGGDASNCYHWFYDSSGGYEGTDAYQDLSADGGTSWTPDTGDDQMFAVYSDWATTTYVGGYTTGDTATQDIEGLDAACPYRFMAQATNSYGTSDGDVETFITIEHMGQPLNLAAVPSSATAISLTWEKGTGAQKTMVRYKVGSYPVDYSDGAEGYFGTGTSGTITGLSPGTLYYFAAWSYAPTDQWAEQEPTTGTHTADAGTDTDTVVDTDDELWFEDDGYYDDDYLYNDTQSAGSTIDSYTYALGTGTLELNDAIAGQASTDEFYIEYRSRTVSMTFAGVSTPESPFTPSDDPNWFLEPDDNALQYLPGRGIIEDFASTMGVGVGVTLAIIFMVIAALVAAITFFVSRNTLITIAVAAIVLLFGLIVGVVPGWIFFLYILIGGGSGYILSKGSSV